MDFFLDTGVFLGNCDSKDRWHGCCKIFFEKYSLTNNGHYTTEKVKIELNNKMLKRRQRGEAGSVLRVIEQAIKALLGEIKIVNYVNHPDFRLMLEAVRKVVNYNNNDTIIVANAIIWSYDLLLNLDTPTFVTVDYTDIINKKGKLKNEAELRIQGKYVPLEIKSPVNL